MRLGNYPQQALAFAEERDVSADIHRATVDRGGEAIALTVFESAKSRDATMKLNPFRGQDAQSPPARFLLGDLGMRGTGNASSRGNWDPPLDIEETEQEYTVTIDLPAMKKEDIKVQLEGGVLTMEGERRLEKEPCGRKYHRVERPYGFFLRRFTVPSIVDAAALRAEYTNGVLKVRLPKSTVSKPTAVDVKVA